MTWKIDNAWRDDRERSCSGPPNGISHSLSAERFYGIHVGRAVRGNVAGKHGGSAEYGGYCGQSCHVPRGRGEEQLMHQGRCAYGASQAKTDAENSKPSGFAQHQLTDGVASCAQRRSIGWG